MEFSNEKFYTILGLTWRENATSDPPWEESNPVNEHWTGIAGL
jgi:hypothetical protein